MDSLISDVRWVWSQKRVSLLFCSRRSSNFEIRALHAPLINQYERWRDRGGPGIIIILIVVK